MSGNILSTRKTYTIRLNKDASIKDRVIVVMNGTTTCRYVLPANSSRIILENGCLYLGNFTVITHAINGTPKQLDTIYRNLTKED